MAQILRRDPVAAKMDGLDQQIGGDQVDEPACQREHRSIVANAQRPVGGRRKEGRYPPNQFCVHRVSP